MATVVDYASLKQAILDYTHRPTLSTYSDYFIQAAQEEIDDDVFAANFGQGIRFMEKEFAPVAIANGVIPVPADWLAPKNLTVTDIDGNQYGLEFKDAQWIYSHYPVRAATGVPGYIARDSSSGSDVFIFGPYPDSAYTIGGVYYAQATLLSSGATTNWMVLNAPSLLLANCMRQAGKFLKDEQMVEGYTQLYQDALAKLIARDTGARFGEGPLVVNGVAPRTSVY